MTSKKQKLELTWIGKESRPKLEARILLEDPARSCHAKHRVTDGGIFDNRQIFWDSVLALKALAAKMCRERVVPVHGSRIIIGDLLSLRRGTECPVRMFPVCDKLMNEPRCGMSGQFAGPTTPVRKRRLQ